MDEADSHRLAGLQLKLLLRLDEVIKAELGRAQVTRLANALTMAEKRNAAHSNDLPRRENGHSTCKLC